MSDAFRKAKLATSMAVARGMAAAMGAGKTAELDALIAEAPRPHQS